MVRDMFNPHVHVHGIYVHVHVHIFPIVFPIVCIVGHHGGGHVSGYTCILYVNK